MRFPRIYLSCWVNHGQLARASVDDATLEEAVERFKIYVESEMRPIVAMPPGFFLPPKSFWEGPRGESPNEYSRWMEPYIYAGAQKKWVWMNRVSLNDEIPFAHRTVGITRKLTVRDVTVYWRTPSKAESKIMRSVEDFR